MYWSVSFWVSPSPFRSSSSVNLASFCRFFNSSLASRRNPRTTTFVSSPCFLQILLSSLRRSSVSGGRGTRTTFPSLDGVMPRPRSRQSLFDFLNQRRLPGLDRDESGLRRRNTGDLLQRSHGAIVVDPNAVEEGDRCPPCPQAGQIAFEMLQRGLHLFRDFLVYSGRVGHERLPRKLAAIGCDNGSDRFAHGDTFEIALLLQIEHDERKVVIHAEADGRGIHHF